MIKKWVIIHRRISVDAMDEKCYFYSIARRIHYQIVDISKFNHQIRPVGFLNKYDKTIWVLDKEQLKSEEKQSKNA